MAKDEPGSRSESPANQDLGSDQLFQAILEYGLRNFGDTGQDLDAEGPADHRCALRHGFGWTQTSEASHQRLAKRLRDGSVGQLPMCIVVPIFGFDDGSQ